MIQLTHPKTVSGDTTESGSSTPSSTHFGIFTTDTGASRCIKVCAIYDDADVPGKVMATMKVCNTLLCLHAFPISFDHVVHSNL